MDAGLPYGIASSERRGTEALAATEPVERDTLVSSDVEDRFRHVHARGEAVPDWQAEPFPSFRQEPEARGGGRPS